MQQCQHDGFSHGISPRNAGTALECPYRTTAEWWSRKLGVEVTLEQVIAAMK